MIMSSSWGEIPNSSHGICTSMRGGEGSLVKCFAISMMLISWFCSTFSISMSWASIFPSASCTNSSSHFCLFSSSSSYFYFSSSTCYTISSSSSLFLCLQVSFFLTLIVASFVYVINSLYKWSFSLLSLFTSVAKGFLSFFLPTIVVVGSIYACIIFPLHYLNCSMLVIDLTNSKTYLHSFLPRSQIQSFPLSEVELCNP